MNLLLFSDLHTDTEMASRIVEASEQFNILVGAGDFCHCRRELDGTISVLRAIQTPTVLVPGNSESFEELKEACAGWSAAQVLHGSGATVLGVPFFGIGGGIPTTPFGAWSYDFTEHEAEELLQTCPSDCVLVSHSPPKGTLDISSAGKSLGSTALRDHVLAKPPRLVVCGHIHESGGRIAKIGDVPVVNAGPQGIRWQLT